MFTVNNYRVVFHHTDNGLDFKDKDWRRVTVCTITDLQTQKVITGKTTCSKEDNYDRNKGRKISLTKALDAGKFDHEERRQFWSSYFEKRGVVN